MMRRQEAGQLFLVGFHGIEPPLEILRLIDEYSLGGVILFKRNLEEPNQIAELARTLQKRAAHKGVPPLFNAVDQEGGVVARLDPPFTEFSSQGDLPEDTAYPDCFHRGASMAGDLKRAGFNFNLAPVMDLRRPGDTSKTGRRCFSEDPHRAGRLGAGVIRGLQEHGIPACAKHFPGLGRAEKDPHEELPRIRGSLDRDLIPFRAAVAHDVAAVMMGHAVYDEYDPERQASLSPVVVQELLRRTLGYRGLVLSDDLEMGAVSRQYSLEDASSQAFEAGCDVLLICSRTEEVGPCISRLLNEVKRSDALNRRLQESLERVHRVKARYLASGSP